MPKYIHIIYICFMFLAGTVHAQEVKIACTCEKSTFRRGCSNEAEYYLIDDSKRKVTLLGVGEDQIIYPSDRKPAGLDRIFYTIEKMDSDSIVLKEVYQEGEPLITVIDRLAGTLHRKTYGKKMQIYESLYRCVKSAQKAAF